MIIVGGLDFNKDAWLVNKFTGGLYEVTKSGDVISHNHYKSSKAGVMKTHKHEKTGYLSISLWDKERKKGVSCLVHRIVALIHVPNPCGLPDVNHIDGNKDNNSASNLEWVTKGENNKHAYDAGLKSALGSKNGQAKIDEAFALKIKERLKSAGTSKEIANEFGVSLSIVKDIRRGETWRHV